MCFAGSAVALFIMIYVIILFIITGQILWMDNKNTKSDRLVFV